MRKLNLILGLTLVMAASAPMTYANPAAVKGAEYASKVLDTEKGAEIIAKMLTELKVVDAKGNSSLLSDILAETIGQKGLTKAKIAGDSKLARQLLEALRVSTDARIVKLNASLLLVDKITQLNNKSAAEIEVESEKVYEVVMAEYSKILANGAAGGNAASGIATKFKAPTAKKTPGVDGTEEDKHSGNTGADESEDEYDSGNRDADFGDSQIDEFKGTLYGRPDSLTIGHDKIEAAVAKLRELRHGGKGLKACATGWETATLSNLLTVTASTSSKAVAQMRTDMIQSISQTTGTTLPEAEVRFCELVKPNAGCEVWAKRLAVGCK